MLIDYVVGLLCNCVTLGTRELLQRLWRQGVEENESLVTLYHLISNHVIGLDIESPFTYRSELWLLPEGLMLYKRACLSRRSFL